jgi:hypothetical protein
MKLIDIPPHQSLVFAKFKQGRTGGRSRQYPIVKTTVFFAEPLLFDYEMPSDPLSRHPKPLRLSFRFEDWRNSHFKRYGIAELDVMQHILAGQFNIKILLSDCSYNTYFTAQLQLPEGSPFLRNCVCPQVPEVVASSASTDSGASSSSSSLSDVLFDATPVRISRARFDELEKQVDLMLADIINANN